MKLLIVVLFPMLLTAQAHTRQFIEGYFKMDNNASYKNYRGVTMICKTGVLKDDASKIFSICGNSELVIIGGVSENDHRLFGLTKRKTHYINSNYPRFYWEYRDNTFTVYKIY